MKWSRDNSIILSKVCILAFACAGILSAIWLPGMLDGIVRDEVFVDSNVRCLRRISWACYLAAAICMMSAFYYYPFAMAAAAACFMGLILRVVKNVFAEAVAIKEENDFTI